MGVLSKASLPFDRQGRPQQAPDVMLGAAFVSEIFAVSQGEASRLDSKRKECEGPVGAVGRRGIRGSCIGFR